MANMIKINDYIEYLPATEAPLSAEVYRIKGENNNYLFDVGISKEAKEIVEDTKNRMIIISHFHPDHMGNLKHIPNDIENLYVGDYTYKILGYGNIIRNIIEINDGINLKIIPMPNSHAKGSLALLVNNEYLLIGDSLYCNTKGYNVSLLNSEIRLLKDLEFKYVLVSHKDNIYPKKAVIEELEYYYSKRSKDKPYISFKVF